MAQKKYGKDIFSLIKKDHREAESLFEKLNSGKREKSIFQKLDMELSIHMEAEEKHFYPRLEEFEETRDQVADALQEHKEAKEMLKELNKLPFDSEQWSSKFDDLQDAIEHHIEDEEGDIFTDAKDVLDQEEIDQMSQSFESEKEKQKQLRKAG